MVSGLRHGWSSVLPRLSDLGRKFENWWTGHKGKLFNIVASDLREIGILTLVFVILDINEGRGGNDLQAMRFLLKCGMFALAAGYVVDLVRK